LFAAANPAVIVYSFLVSRRDLTQRLLLILVFCAGLAAASHVYHDLILPAGPFSYDEAAHAIRGRLIAWDAGQADWLALLFDTYRQVYWPPIHSWLTGGMFLLRGESEVSARAVSLVLWIPIALTLFLAARRLEGRASPLAGVVAAALTLTSPPLMDFAAQCMLEIPGLLGVSLALLAYFRTVDDDNPRANLLLAAALLAAFFVKINYGVLLMMTVGLMRLVDAHCRPRRLLSRNNLALALPIGAVFAVWFAYPAKLLVTWQTLTHRPFGGVGLFTWDGLLFYPRALVEHSGSPLLFVIYVGALVLGLWDWRDRKVRMLAALAVLQFLIGELHHTKDERHILPMLPALFLLTDHSLLAWRRRARSARRKVAVWAPHFVSVLILARAIALPGSVEPRSAAGGEDVIEHVSSLAREPGPGMIISVSGLDFPTAPLLEWALLEQGLLDPPQAGSMMQPLQERKLADAAGRLPEWLAAKLTPVFSRAEQPGKPRTLILGAPAGFDAPVFGRFFPSTYRRGGYARVVVVRPIRAAPVFPLPGQREALLELVASREFADAGTCVDLYR